MNWAYLIIPVIVVLVGFIAFKMRKESKALTNSQQDSMDTRARFNQPDGANQGTPVRNFNGFSG